MTSALLKIGLGSITSNWHLLKKKAVAAECSSVVKADAYGCGMKQVTSALVKAGCKVFFVAQLSEGIVLRKLDPSAAIYIFNGLLQSPAAEYFNHNLHPVLNSVEELQEWLGASQAPFALHFDTGMNRLGVKPDQISQLPQCEPLLVMSHFVSSEKQNDLLNQKQIDEFETLRKRYPKAKASMANSSAIFLKEKPFYDLVRPGYALYGGNPVPGEKNPMHNVVSLQAPVLQVKHVRAGETAGYNGIWTAKRDSVIITLPIGYADGFLRSGSASNDKKGAQVAWQGRLYPVVGRISMDLITVDVTGAPQPPKRSDLVEIIGEHLTIDKVAENAGTIGYEVLTSLGKRYERRYI